MYVAAKLPISSKHVGVDLNAERDSFFSTMFARSELGADAMYLEKQITSCRHGWTIPLIFARTKG